MRVEIDLLGNFAVRVDGRVVPAAYWRRRHAAALVKLLALAPRRTLHREQVVDALWPEIPTARSPAFETTGIAYTSLPSPPQRHSSLPVAGS